MTRKGFLLVFIGVLSFVSCKRTQTATGIIFERKHLHDNKLQLKYRYQLADTKYVDSITINNQVIKSDTISLRLDPENPSKAFVDLKK